MLEKWGIYSFFSVTWIQGQCTISLFVSIPMTTYFGVLYSPKPHLTLLKLAASGSLLFCNVCSHRKKPAPTNHPSFVKEEPWTPRDLPMKAWSILPQIKFFMWYLYKSPAHGSLPCPPSTPPAVLTPQVPLASGSASLPAAFPLVPSP